MGHFYIKFRIFAVTVDKRLLKFSKKGLTLETSALEPLYDTKFRDKLYYVDPRTIKIGSE